MKKLKVLVLGLALSFGFQASSAQGLGDILKGLGGSGNDLGNTIGNFIDGIFTKTDLSLSDLVGEYVSQGPAVTFKSDNFLQKAGGIAGAAAIETKLQPYYEKYGLTGMTLTIDNDANFNMKVKGMTLKGTITKNDEEGTFNFNFQVVGMNLGKFVAYVEKSGNNLNLMFDANKLMTIISAIAKFTGNQLASTLSTILDSYDGACIGFKMVSTGNSSNNSSSSTGTSTENGGANTNSGLDALKGLLNKGK